MIAELIGVGYFVVGLAVVWILGRVGVDFDDTRTPPPIAVLWLWPLAGLVAALWAMGNVANRVVYAARAQYLSQRHRAAFRDPLLVEAERELDALLEEREET